MLLCLKMQFSGCFKQFLHICGSTTQYVQLKVKFLKNAKDVMEHVLIQIQFAHWSVNLAAAVWMIPWCMRANASLQMNVPNCLVSVVQTHGRMRQDCCSLQSCYAKMQLLVVFNNSFHVSEAQLRVRYSLNAKDVMERANNHLYPAPRSVYPAVAVQMAWWLMRANASLKPWVDPIAR